MISIIIPTKNAGPNFDKTLAQIFKQSEKNFEVIIVDSGSKDETLGICKKFPVRLYEIDPSEFNHGKTRNYGASLAKGDTLVFMTQDAIPFNEEWLANLVAPLNEDEVACSFSRQLSTKETHPMEKFFLSYWYPEKRIVRPNENFTTHIENLFFSNVSSAYKREIFDKFKFSETLIMTEDQDYTRRIIDAGYKTVYEPKSKVFHFHNYTLKWNFKRHFDASCSFKIVSRDKLHHYVKNNSKYVAKEFSYLVKNHISWIPYYFLYAFSRTSGAFIGRYAKFLPKFFVKKCSDHSYHWD
jgi:rhamnosyltransferase